LENQNQQLQTPSLSTVSKQQPPLKLKLKIGQSDASSCKGSDLDRHSSTTDTLDANPPPLPSEAAVKPFKLNFKNSMATSSTPSSFASVNDNNTVGSSVYNEDDDEVELGEIVRVGNIKLPAEVVGMQGAVAASSSSSLNDPYKKL
jgi:hypothetical protein